MKSGNKRFLTCPVRKKFSNRAGFTIVELLTVLAIIAILIGVLLPALTNVRTKAKEATQKAQITTIDLAILTFKNDYGDYPPSDWKYPEDYCGAQKLTEALLGWDLLGFHPKSAWRADGYDGLTTNGPLTYDPDKVRGDASLQERKGRYLELSTANVFKLGSLFNNTGSYLAPNTYVLCDVFGVRQIILSNVKPVKAGTPILYYKANTSSKSMVPTNFAQQIYNAYDNLALISLGILRPDGSVIVGKQHPLGSGPYGGEFFYDPSYKIIDPKVTARPWPHRPDSYILISAGADGKYGTADDITNF